MTINVHSQEWEGPFIDRFQVYDDTHGDVVQYRCQLEKTVFRYYAPKPFLKGVFGTEWPEVLVVSVGKTDLPLSEMGFRGKAIPPKTDTDFWEYQYSTRKEQPANPRYTKSPTKVNGIAYTCPMRLWRGRQPRRG